MRVVHSKTLSETPDVENFASVYRSSKCVIDLARQGGRSERDKLDRRRSTKLTIHLSSDARPLVYYSNHQAVSTVQSLRGLISDSWYLSSASYSAASSRCSTLEDDISVATGFEAKIMVLVWRVWSRSQLSYSCPWVHFVWPDPTQPISWPTQPNPTHYKWKTLDATRPNQIQLTNLTSWCNQILSNRALNALTQSFQNFSTFAVVDPTQPNPRVNPTHGQLWIIRSQEFGLILIPVPRVWFRPQTTCTGDLMAFWHVLPEMQSDRQTWRPTIRHADIGR